MKAEYRVLLISPLPGIDPACGDIVYTQTLLAHPPAGVEYVTYADALASGDLVEHANRQRFRREPVLTSAAKTINVLRKNRVLFWEPFRFFSVKPGAFDLVHVHVFSPRFLALPCPLVVSNAAPLRSLYTDARGYSYGRTVGIELVERTLAKMMGVNHTSYRLPQASRVIAFTQYLKNWYVSRKIVPADRVDVVPIYLRGQTTPTPSNVKRPTTVGFIAKDFDAKGGPTLLKAFEVVRRARPDARLVIVGCPPRIEADEAERRGIRWLSYVPREQLLSEIIPSFDVFAYPTGFDGQPLVMIEAMAAGVAVATSNYQAMPEMVDHGGAGLISPVGDANAVASDILKLLEPEMNLRYRNAARNWFEQTFSDESVMPKLKMSYECALGAVAA